MSSFNIKLEFDSSSKVNKALDYCVCDSFFEIIEHLIIQLMNSTIQAVYLASVCDYLYSWII